MVPLLRLLDDGRVQQFRVLQQIVLGETTDTLDDDDDILRGWRRPSDSRAALAMSHLVGIGAVERPSRGQFRITDLGRQILMEFPRGLTQKDVASLTDYAAAQRRSSGRHAGASGARVRTTLGVQTVSPTDQIADGVERLRQRVTAELLVGVRNTIGVDVGEGTVNFPVFTDGAFNSEAAGTLDQGYGTALTNALDRMSTSGDKDLRFKNRKALADFLQQTPSVFLQGRFDRAKGYVDEESEYLTEEIASRFEDVLTEVGGTTKVVYVYGGGSGPIKEILRPILQKAAGTIPVLYLDAAYSRHLNREGLYLAARAVEPKRPAKRAKAVA